MDKLKVSIYLLFVGFLISGIASFMEFYKKKIRKDKVKKVEAHIISIILSSLAVLGLNGLHIFIPFIYYYFAGASIWLDYIMTGLAIYLLQYQVDMKIFKNLIKTAAINLLSKYGINISKEDINKLLGNSNTE